MTWPGALFFIDAMNAASYLGISDWRLPSTLIPDPGCVVPTSPTGFNCSGSEMGHLFYTEFGATANTTVLATGNSTETDKFSNLLNVDTGSIYWSSLELDANTAYAFRFDKGQQVQASQNTPIGVWAVRDGDIGAIPIPASIWLLGSGLLGLFVLARFKIAT